MTNTKPTKLAVLLTCFNRKQKTLDSLTQLFKAQQHISDKIQLKVYLTDDGSTDGTSEAVKEQFPQVMLLKGNGELYWAGGMRNSWNQALQTHYDAFLLLNDDTNVKVNFLATLLETHNYCTQQFGQSGIYIGSTQDENTKKLSYGGAVLTNSFLFKFHFVTPGNKPKNCDLGNANIMWVPKEVVDKIGPLAKGYIHGVADYDYTLRAKKAKIPVLIAPGYLGSCTDDHDFAYKNFHKLSLKQRWAKLKSPIGLDLKSNLLLQQRFFPQRVPFVLGSAFFKLLFPKLYLKRFTLNH